MKGLTDKEDIQAKKHLNPHGGFRKTAKRMNAIRKMFNGLCKDCKQKVWVIGTKTPNNRMEALGNTKTYCEKCQSMIEEINQKYKE